VIAVVSVLVSGQNMIKRGYWNWSGWLGCNWSKIHWLITLAQVSSPCSQAWQGRGNAVNGECMLEIGFCSWMMKVCRLQKNIESDSLWNCWSLRVCSQNLLCYFDIVSVCIMINHLWSQTEQILNKIQVFLLHQKLFQLKISCWICDHFSENMPTSLWNYNVVD